MLVIRDLYEEERGARERKRARDLSYGTLVSRSPRMQEVFDLIDQVAPTTATILIQGESGTGKELVAREVHKRSRRAAGPFHGVNCAALASEILESEFFGHEKGAFTGAVALKPGRFEVAHTGTIFLDEVAELPLELQAKLLRVLEERAFERVGGTRAIQVDVRVIAATNRDLAQFVQQGRFREDLYYRLRVVPIRLPALRERMEDVELLADRLLQRVTEREGKEALRLAPDALRAMLDHAWPGNVRELANAIVYAAVISKGPWVGLADLPREFRQQQPAPTATDAARPDPIVLDASRLLGDERARVEAALQSAKWSHGKAADLLGMHRTTLHRKRTRYGL
jgi:transcriptional regulator with PAS, ATPase and Fis domain